MSRADLHSAAYDARGALADGFENCGRDMDSIFAGPLAAINRALRGDDAPVWLSSAATVLCMVEPGHGSPSYRGDPVPAVALQQEAEALAARLADDAAARIVGDEVRGCVSSLISSLLESAYSDGALIDEATAEALSGAPAGADEFRDALDSQYVCEEVTDPADGAQAWRWYDRDALDEEEGAPDIADSDLFDDEEEALRDLFESERLEQPDGREAFEHWIVSGWLADKLRARGESVADDVCGLTVWARTTTGQMIRMDSVFQSIARAITADEERQPTQAELEAARDAMAIMAAPVRPVSVAEAAGEQFAALSQDPVSHYRNAANVFAIACRARFGFDPRDVLS